MTHQEYEALVRSMVQELTAHTQALVECHVSGGAQNLILGASGFRHQVDVAVQQSPALLLIECKYWSDPVDVEPVLVLASRIADIAGCSGVTQVRGSIVSTKQATAGAKVVAAHFGISIDTVINPHEYAVRVFDHVFVGIQERANATDTSNAYVTRENGG